MNHYEIINTNNGLKLLSFDITHFNEKYYNISGNNVRLLPASKEGFLYYQSLIKKDIINLIPQQAIDKYKANLSIEIQDTKARLGILIDSNVTIRQIERSIELVGIEKHLEIIKDIENV